MNSLNRPRLRTAPGVAATSIGGILMGLGTAKRETRLADEENARRAALGRGELLMKYADRPEFSFEDGATPTQNPNAATSAALRAGLMANAMGPGMGLTGAALRGAIGEMPDIPDPRRHVTDLDLGDGKPLRVMFDPNRTPEALKARAKAEEAAAIARANRGAFDQLRQLDPDSFTETDYSDDVEWSKFLPDAMRARGHERTMLGTGQFDAPSAHLESFHNYNLPAEQRARQSNAREQGRYADWQIDRALEGISGQARQLIAEGMDAKLVYEEIRQMPAARGIPEGRLRAAVLGAQDANAIAANRDNGTPRRDPSFEERRRGIVDMIGRTPVDDVEQTVVDELAKGTSAQDVTRLIETSSMLTPEEKQRAKAMLGRYGRRFEMRSY